jgi:hypothetical protein
VALRKGKATTDTIRFQGRKKLRGVKSLNVPLTCLNTVADAQGPIDHNPLAHQHQIAWTLKKSLYLKLSHTRFDVNIGPLIRTGVFIDDSTIRS